MHEMRLFLTTKPFNAEVPMTFQACTQYSSYRGVASSPVMPFLRPVREGIYGLLGATAQGFSEELLLSRPKYTTILTLEPIPPLEPIPAWNRLRPPIPA